MRGDSGLRISHVGLRGIVGRGLTAGHILDFAAAFGTFLEPGGPVVVGRDPRASGRMAWEGVVSGLTACGHDVVDLGIVSTPVVQHALQRLDAAGGIAISASHNPAEWNALRFLGPRGTYLSTAEAGELLDIYHLRKFRFVGWDKLGALRADEDAIDRYIDDLGAVFDFASLRAFRVVVDCCNGTSALILRRMADRFGLDLVLINERVEGVQFAHEPTTSARMVELQLGPLMKPLNAHAGFLFDVDSDRVAMADEQGRGVSEELMLPLLADHQLSRGPGKIVITNLSSSALLEDVAARHGGRVVRVPVGRQAAMDALAAYRPEQIAAAGEGTGAVMMPQFRFIYDGIASMLAVLTMMKERASSLSGLLAGYPRYSILKGEVRLETPRVPELLLDIAASFPDGRADRSDGLRVSWPDRWFHVRVSHTEPIIRVICEQRGDPPQELFDTLMDKVRSHS
jgi:phosphomannomutase